MPEWDRAALRRILSDRLSLDEVYDLAFDLGIDYESLPGEGRNAKARNLLLALERRGALDALTIWLHENRRDIALPTTGPVEPSLAPAPPTPAPPSSAVERIRTLAAQLEEANAEQDWATVIRLGERILALDADHEPTRTITANAYYQFGKQKCTDKACNVTIINLDRAIRLDPTVADYFYWRGESYHYKEDYDLAIADYIRAIQLDPNQANYYNSRGISHHTKGNDDQAIADLTYASQLDPGKPDYYLQMGKIYHEKGNYTKATHCYALAQAKSKYGQGLNSTEAEIHYRMGLAYKSLQRIQIARRYFERAAEMGHSEAKAQLAKL